MPLYVKIKPNNAYFKNEDNEKFIYTNVHKYR